MSELTPYEQMQANFGCKLTPELHSIDGGASFLGFLGFASKSWPIEQFAKEFPEKIAHTKESAAQFIDWLIENHWGEEDKAPPNKSMGGC